MRIQNKHNLLYEEESYKIRGACFDVYNVLGGGIKENIISRALVKELMTKGLDIESQVKINIIYNGEKIGVYITDLVINKKIIIEVKSKPYLTKVEKPSS